MSEHRDCSTAVGTAEEYALLEVSDEIDELLQSFITMESPNDPQWDRAQARMASYIQRLISNRVRAMREEHKPRRAGTPDAT